MRTSRILIALGMLIPGLLGAQDTAASAASTTRALEQLAKGELVAGLPAAKDVSPGARSVAAGTIVTGTIVARGPVDVYGTVSGSAVSLSGDVRVHPGGTVTGDAIAVGGEVHADSGRVDGEMRSMGSLPALLPGAVPAAAVLSPTRRTIDAARMVGGVFAILLIIAVAVLLFAGRNLDEVVFTLERQFGRAFWVGLLAQLFIAPALVLLCLALALTVIGVLLIPFAVVAYAIAVAGLVTLGFLAVARLVGGSFWRGGGSVRARALGALSVGIAIFFTMWIVAALLTWAPLPATVIRAAALAATWAAATLGLGSALLSRAGTHRRVVSGSRPAQLASWQTPTPITGVVAARRPVAMAEDAR